MADTVQVADAAEALLATCADLLDDPPERQYVAWQASALDCSALTVAPQSPYLVWATDQRGRAPITPALPRQSPGVPVLSFRVRLSLQCWPAQTDINTLSASEINAAAYEALTQGGTLWLGLVRLANDSTLFEGVLPDEACAGVQIGPATPQGPQGGIVTTSIDVTAMLLEPATP